MRNVDDHWFADPAQAGLDPDKIDTLLTRVRREIDAGLATKAIVAAAAWLLIQDGRLAEAERVADIIPEFADNGKGTLRVEQLLAHTAGFPAAPFQPWDWLDPGRRMQRFADWRTDWDPGSRFVYHPTSSMWVVAEIIERRSGLSFQQFIREQLLHGGLGDTEIWQDTTLARARHIRTGEFRDPDTNQSANRGLGLIVAGDAFRNVRGFDKTNSPEAFGHNGAGGQLAWADPATGLSLGYCTSGHDRNWLRRGRRGTAVSSLAAVCLAEATV